MAKEYHEEREAIGFNPITKRAVGFFKHREHGSLVRRAIPYLLCCYHRFNPWASFFSFLFLSFFFLFSFLFFFSVSSSSSSFFCVRKQVVAKGLVDKILNNADDDDGGLYCWKVARCDELTPMVRSVDEAFASRGFKTIAVSVKQGDGPMTFVGIVPMLDPPRHDTKSTIALVRNAGVNVKMITGDHLFIAKELARQIDLGTNILPNTDLWPVSAMRDQLVLDADGFAKVLPADKYEVVSVLQKAGYVVGMTGDGVNDAPGPCLASQPQRKDT